MAILIIIIALLVNFVVSMKFSDIATEKGYDGKNYFWACFFLGVAGYVMVAALPDQSLYHLLAELQNGKTSKCETSQKFDRIADHASAPPSGCWACSCGRVNANYVSTCSCGTSKRDAVK